MSESLALSELVKRLEMSKEKELKQVQRIEQEKLHELSRRLQERLNSELSTIVDDMEKRLYGFSEKLTEARSGIVKQERELLKEIKKQQQQIRADIEESDRQLKQIASRSQLKKLLYPTMIGIAVVAGLAIGSWSLGAYASHQLRVIEDHKKTIVELEQLIQEQNKAKDKWIKKTWSNAIGVEKEPSVWKDTKENLWIVQFEKGQ